MTNNSFLNVGENNVNGFVINIVRKVSAQQVSATSRIAARYFGTIVEPNGNIIQLGDKGKTAGQIKAIIGIASARENSELAKLKKALAQLLSLGLNTAEIEEKIAAAEEREAQARANSLAEKARKKELKKLQAIKEQLLSLGLNTAEIEEKIEGLL